MLSDLLQNSLKTAGDTSLQRRLYRIIRAAILQGQLGPGQKIPSSRALASELLLSRVTILGAYENLLAEGYLVSRRGSGTFVADTPLLPQPVSTKFQATAPSPGITKAISVAPMLSLRGSKAIVGTRGITAYEGAFVPGVADVRHFPFHQWLRVQNRYWRKQHLQLTGYGDNGGYRPLRQALAEYLQVSRSVRCRPEQIIITAGTHQSIDLCARMLTDPGDAAIVEDPCHWAGPVVLQAAGLDVMSIQVDDEGLCLPPHPLPSAVRLAFVTPSHQYPSGVSMSLPRRNLLLERAHAQNFWIMEDDYDSEFRYDTQPLPSLQGSDAFGRVIYLGTFSKVMYPGLRLSYMVVPEDLAESFSVGLTQLFRPGSLVTQAAMAEFITQGYFATHIRRMRNVYAERQAELRRALACNFGDQITLSNGKAGLHLTSYFRRGIDLGKMAKLAEKEGVMLRALSHYQQGTSDKQGFLLGYGGVATDAVGGAVKKMLAAYEQC